MLYIIDEREHDGIVKKNLPATKEGVRTFIKKENVILRRRGAPLYKLKSYKGGGRELQARLVYDWTSIEPKPKPWESKPRPHLDYMRIWGSKEAADAHMVRLERAAKKFHEECERKSKERKAARQAERRAAHDLASKLNLLDDGEPARPEVEGGKVTLHRREDGGQIRFRGRGRVEEHDEGADRGGYVPTWKMGEESATWDDIDGEWV